MSSIKLSDVIFDETIYPRSDLSTNVVNEYVDVLRAGGGFPAIVLQTETNKLLDGRHRWEAHKKYIKEYNETKEDERENWSVPNETIEFIYQDVPDGIPPKLYAASLSSTHGLRLAAGERRNLAREIYTENPLFTLSVLAEYLAVSTSAAHTYVSDILAKQKEERNATINKLNRLGWTQEEIGEKVELTGQAVGQTLKEFPEMEKLSKSLFDSGLTIEEIAKRFNVPRQLVYAIGLEGKEDKERTDKLDIKLQPYDVWNFAGCDDLYGADYPGRIPGQLVAHVLYFYTNPGDLIIDPMVGSGTTLDVSLVMGRKCYGYDVAPFGDRKDIIEHNLEDGWPERTKKADLIFWDAPYYKKKDDENVEGGYGDKSISKKNRQEYLDFFAKRFKDLHETVKPGTKLAFLMSDWLDFGSPDESIFQWDYTKLLLDAGWKIRRQIQTPLSTQQTTGSVVTNYRENKKLYHLERYLLIAEA